MLLIRNSTSTVTDILPAARRPRGISDFKPRTSRIDPEFLKLLPQHT